LHDWPSFCADYIARLVDMAYVHKNTVRQAVTGLLDESWDGGMEIVLWYFLSPGQSFRPEVVEELSRQGSGETTANGGGQKCQGIAMRCSQPTPNGAVCKLYVCDGGNEES